MSNVELTIKAEENVGSFYLFETTGDYSKDNLCGYGKPNIKQSSVTKAYFDIYPPCKATTPFRIDVTGYFPNEDCTGYEVLPPMLSSQIIKSGKYIIRYTIEGIDDGVAFKYYTEIQCIFTKQAECVVDKMLANASGTPINKLATDKKSKSIQQSVLFEFADWGKECGYYDEADRLLCHIQNQCVTC